MAFNYSKNDATQEKEATASTGFAPWPAGTYDAEVIRSEQTVSKTSGADMIALGIKIFNDQEKFAFVNDYLVGSDNLYSKHKIKTAAIAMGLEQEWADGTLDADMMMGKCFKAKIKIGKQQPKNDGTGDLYPAKNEMQEYIVDNKYDSLRAERRAADPKQAADDLDDSIPF